MDWIWTGKARKIEKGHVGSLSERESKQLYEYVKQVPVEVHFYSDSCV